MTKKFSKFHIAPWEEMPVIYPARLHPIPDKDIYMDIGPGRGDFLFHLARSRPGSIAIGIEVKRMRVDKIIKRLQRFRINNAAIVQGDARNVLPKLFSKPRAKEIHIRFPDPWPKKRHAKHRLLNKDMIRAACDALLPEGELVIVTDVEGYAEEAIEGIITPDKFETIKINVGSGEEIFPTLFAEKWRDEGRTISEFRFRKKYQVLSTEYQVQGNKY